MKVTKGFVGRKKKVPKVRCRAAKKHKCKGTECKHAAPHARMRPESACEEDCDWYDCAVAGCRVRCETVK